MLDDIHYLGVGDAGTYAAGDPLSSPNHVTAIVNYLVTNQIKTLTIYCHGGLNDDKLVKKSVENIFPKFQQVDPKNHNLAILWRTDIKTTISQNLERLVGLKFVKNLLLWAARAISIKVGYKPAKAGLNNPANFQATSVS